MSNTLVQRLKALVEFRDDDTPVTRLIVEAALEIERLQAQLAAAREYVNAYVENRDVPAGVTGGLRLIEEIDNAVRIPSNLPGQSRESPPVRTGEQTNL